MIKTTNRRLEISFIGYKSMEISIKGKTNLDIVLADDVELLDEIVVVGYMTQKKGLVTGAVSSMKVDETMKAFPTTSAGNILVGKLAGVSVSTPNAIPGSNPSISIRTSSSWDRDSNKNPQPVTYVINGISDPAGWTWSQDEIDYFRNINGGGGYDQLETVGRNSTNQLGQVKIIFNVNLAAFNWTKDMYDPEVRKLFRFEYIECVDMDKQYKFNLDLNHGFYSMAQEVMDRNSNMEQNNEWGGNFDSLK